jgi:hypothetical protein
VVLAGLATLQSIAFALERDPVLDEEVGEASRPVCHRRVGQTTVPKDDAVPLWQGPSDSRERFSVVMSHGWRERGGTWSGLDQQSDVLRSLVITIRQQDMPPRYRTHWALGLWPTCCPMAGPVSCGTPRSSCHMGSGTCHAQPSSGGGISKSTIAGGKRDRSSTGGRRRQSELGG